MIVMTMAVRMVITILTTDEDEGEATCAAGFACTVQANTAPLLFPPRLSMTTRGLSEDQEEDDED